MRFAALEHNGTLKRIKVFQSVPLCSIVFHQESAKTALAGQKRGFGPVEHPPPGQSVPLCSIKGLGGNNSAALFL